MQHELLHLWACFPNEERSRMAEQAFPFHPRHRGCHHSEHIGICAVSCILVPWPSALCPLHLGPRTSPESFHCPTKLVFGHLSMQQLPSLLSWLTTLGLTRVIVFPASRAFALLLFANRHFAPLRLPTPRISGKAGGASRDHSHHTAALTTCFAAIATR